MYGKFWSYAPVRCADGAMGPSGNGALPGVQAEDRFGNVHLYGRPRKGEGVKGWIRRQVADALDCSGAVWVAPVKDGQGFYLHHGYYMMPWFADPNARVITVDETPGFPGEYRVGVHRYVVDMVKH